MPDGEWVNPIWRVVAALKHAVDTGGDSVIIGKDHKSTVSTHWANLLSGDKDKKVMPIIAAPLIENILVIERKVVLRTGGSIRVIGSENVGMLRGVLRNPTLFVCDDPETFQPADLYEVIRPMYQDHPSTSILLVGTPYVRGGALAYGYASGGRSTDGKFESWHISTVEARPDLAEHVEAMREEIPYDRFDREYLAKIITV